MTCQPQSFTISAGVSMPNTDYHFEETKPAPMQPLVDFESAQDTHQPSDYADWIPDVRAVVIGAKQIESEAEALGAEWSSAMDLDTAGFGEDVDWYEPPEYMTGDQDEESYGHLPFLEEFRVILLEVDEIVVGAMRVQEDAEAPAESSDARDAVSAALPGNTPGEIELRPEKTVTDTKAATPGAPKPSVKRADKRSSGTRRSNKGSR